jgi:hypothetical protein
MNLRNRDRIENLTLAGIRLAAFLGENGSACVSGRMTRSPQILQSLMVAANGEAGGPDDHVSQARGARNFDWVPPRLTTHASRPPQ